MPQTLVILQTLSAALDPPPPPVESDLATVLQTLYDRRFTGTLTLHLRGGKPRVAEFSGPQIKLCP